MEEGKGSARFRSTSTGCITNREYEQSDMYRPNDVLIEGHRLSNLFNSQDEDWHNEQIRPIRALWSMTKVLEYEPLIDETITKFVEKLAQKFVDGKNAGTVCPADEWIGFCKHWTPCSL